jgi:hypothetical protein
MVRISVLYPNEPGKRPRSNSSASTRSPDPPAAGATADRQAEGFRRLEVDDEVEPIELLNRQISGVAALRILARL